MPKAVFFDQDNTLINTSKIAKGIYKEIISKLSSRYNYDPEMLYEKWIAVVSKVKFSKNPAERSFLYSLTLALREAGLDTALAKEADTVLKQEVLKKITLNPGVRKTIIELSRRGFKIVVFTEDRRALHLAKMKQVGLDKYIDISITADDTKVMKPAPEYLKIAWRKLGLDPNECVYVGDNWEKDCRIGQEAGGIGVLYGSNDQRANYNISEMRELLNLAELS